MLLGWGLFPLILLEGVAELFHTVGWRYCLTEPHRSLPFVRIFCVRMAGAAMNYVTPTAAMGGEITKGTLLAMTYRGPEAATGVIIGKLAFALGQLLFVVVGSLVILRGMALPAGVWIGLLAGSTLLGGGILGFLVAQKYGKMGVLVRWMVARRVGGKTLEQAAGHVTQVDHALKCFYAERPWDLVFAMLWHIMGCTFGIVQCWCFIFLLRGHASPLIAAGIWFLGAWMDLLSFAIPFNIGVLEATRTLAFRVAGFHAALGLTYGVALRFVQIFWAGVGLLFYAMLMTEKRGSGHLHKKGVANGAPFRFE
jgi:hypothetical protein